MSTHNICFYGELTKNYLSIIIKYPPYLFNYKTAEFFSYCERNLFHFSGANMIAKEA